MKSIRSVYSAIKKRVTNQIHQEPLKWVKLSFKIKLFEREWVTEVRTGQVADGGSIRNKQCR